MKESAASSLRTNSKLPFSLFPTVQPQIVSNDPSLGRNLVWSHVSTGSDYQNKAEHSGNWSNEMASQQLVDKLKWNDNLSVTHRLNKPSVHSSLHVQRLTLMSDSYLACRSCTHVSYLQGQCCSLFLYLCVVVFVCSVYPVYVTSWIWAYIHMFSGVCTQVRWVQDHVISKEAVVAQLGESWHHVWVALSE